MNDWIDSLRTRLDLAGNVVRVVMATVRGSAPREPGACLLVDELAVTGTIGGGHLEFKAIEIARMMLEQPVDATRIDRFALGATLGQCCGGAVNLWFERFDADALDFLAKAAAARDGGEPVALMTYAKCDKAIGRTLVSAATIKAVEPARAQAAASILQACNDAPRAALVRVDDASVLIERIDSAYRPLWLFGAGHVGKALARLLGALPFDVTWVDSRQSEFPAQIPPNVKALCTTDPVASVAQAPRDAFWLVLTHSHDLDYAICRALLERDDFAWAGLIGSETKAACFNIRLARDGVPAHRVARLVSPIGIEGIDSKLPAAIAVSIAAQLLQLEQSQLARSTATTGAIASL